MKRILLPLFLVAGIALVLFLFKPPADERFVLNQGSELAIINLEDPEQVEAFLEHGIKVVSPHANPQTIVRIPGHTDPISLSNLNIETPGKVSLINPGGIIVGDTANLNWAISEDQANLQPPGDEGGYIEIGNLQTSAEVIKDGNIYALAINRGGKIQATKSKSTVRKPTTFDFPDLDESPIISDE